MTGWILRTNGNVEKVSENLQKQDGSLADLYEAIGCTMVQLVTAPWGEFWVDEEGLFRQPENLNRLATRIYWDTFPHVEGQPLMGDVYLRVKATKQGKLLASALEMRAANPVQ